LPARPQFGPCRRAAGLGERLWFYEFPQNRV
jgi:hypothetical protein